MFSSWHFLFLDSVKKNPTSDQFLSVRILRAIISSVKYSGFASVKLLCQELEGCNETRKLRIREGCERKLVDLQR